MTGSDVQLIAEAQQTASSETHRGLLRFITCGSVDDGKSTLIGRLLYDSGLLLDDQLSALEGDSHRLGTAGRGLDFALLLDGLQAEWEQGITIDVAYRFFATSQRKFIVADTPGHEQYTRNMATGASTADLAVILVDARKGVLTQTMRHSYIVSLLGIRQVVLAVNKMDLVGHSKETFEAITQNYLVPATKLGFQDITCIPVSALKGDNLFTKSTNMPWYAGPSLLDHLEAVEIAFDHDDGPFRMPVQWVNRPNLDFRGYSGTIVGGRIRSGDAIVVLPSGMSSRVSRIVTFDGDLHEGRTGQAVTLTLEDEIDVGRGDIIAAIESQPEITDQFRAHVLWMDREQLVPGRSYEMKIGCQTAVATVSDIRYVINVNSLEHTAAKALGLNEIGVCNVSLDRPIACDPYAANRKTGAFILIDRYTKATVGAGMIEYGLRRATNLVWQDLQIDKVARSKLKDQKACVLWFTGLSGSGKSTIADHVEKRLHVLGHHTLILDGDNVRHGLNRDLGFTDADRVENIRRISEVSKLFVEAGLIVLVSFISPFRCDRQMARELQDESEFLEIFVDTPLQICEDRDPKGLYKKARAGEIPNFTGIDSPYEAPDNPEIHLETGDLSEDEACDRIVRYLREHGVI